MKVFFAGFEFQILIVQYGFQNILLWYHTMKVLSRQRTVASEVLVRFYVLSLMPGVE
jgi:hypothetical protein